MSSSIVVARQADLPAQSSVPIPSSDAVDEFDHRSLISAYDLGHVEQHSPGLIHWHPNGVKVLHHLEHLIRKLHAQHSYQEVRSPAILSRSLWEKSGHWDKYQDLMFAAKGSDGVEYAVKPMSCPGQIAIYQHRRRSYRELPFKLFEFGHVHRFEPSGALSGWLRLRGFVQDDSHVFAAPDQIEQVIGDFVSMVNQVYPRFGFDSWSWRISLRPDKRAGDDQLWDRAENALRQACLSAGIQAQECPGEGAFYGPKLEVVLIDRLGRSWQCGVAQVDFVLPDRFELEYQNAQGDRVSPVLIHHAVFGSLERWLSIVLEHNGRLPAALAPVMVGVCPISQHQADAAYQLVSQLKHVGICAQVEEDGPLPGRLRSLAGQMVPYWVVLGQREIEQNSVSVRFQGGKPEVIDQSKWIDDIAKQCQEFRAHFD